MADASQLLDEILAAAPPEAKAERGSAGTMGNISKLRYTHEAMVDLIIQHPEISQNQIASLFGYTPSWISNVMASDAFQERLASRRSEVCDPILRATLEERTRALYLQSLAVLQAKLEMPEVDAKVALAAAELGAKSLGLGQPQPNTQPSGDRLTTLAARLMQLNPQNGGTIYEVQVSETNAAIAAG